MPQPARSLALFVALLGGSSALSLSLAHRSPIARRAAAPLAALEVDGTEEVAKPEDTPAVAPGSVGDPFMDRPFSDVELAERESKLTALSKKWEKYEANADYEESKRSGWGPSPERINGRTAMFFILTGLITEYYTGQSLPQQVYTMLQTLSIVE